MRKGISPLIASVLLIAFTMSVAVLAGPFLTDLQQSTQQSTAERAEKISTAADMGLQIQSAKYEPGSTNLSIFVQNTGDRKVSSISISAIGASAYQNSFDRSLARQEVESFELDVGEKFRVEQLRASLENYPVSSKVDTRLAGMKYEWYDTQQHYNDEGHPTTTAEFNEFFDESLTNVSLQGTGAWNRRIHWHDSSWDQKPSYLPGNGYSWKAEGYLYAPASGEYTIGLDSDDAADVWIDGKLAVSWYDAHGIDSSYGHSSNVNLTKGWHRFKARMEEGSGGDGISVAWKKPGSSSFKVIKRSSYITHSYSN